ncbi:Hypothetical protein, predicted transmembrane, DUF285 family [Mycoplasma yeatsii 13926]|uniref:PARCEL domain-containing protein n=1 Tax=Mycoplasma yeatsii 13926 TaxID=1188240 RepID=S6G882_9MOLU|nr:BspA family leucine-rich repeat surface protein [Mycoplasma yeatsii]EOA06935.1 Hypothetical protein, predicted transmembrane, DUF285 family [Mycoplasma yeatsii 13926]
MKLTKKMIPIIGATVIGSAGLVGAGFGAGIWYSQPKTKIKDLSSLISNKSLGELDESIKNNKEKIIELIKEKNPNLDPTKVEFDIQDDKVIVKPKVGDKTYKGEVEIGFLLTTIDIKTLVEQADLGELDESYKDNKQKIIELIKEKNPNLDIEKVSFDIQGDKVIVTPKSDNKTYKGQAEIIFKIVSEKQAIINKIKSIWDSEFKDRFVDETLTSKFGSVNYGKSLTNETLLKSVTRRLKANDLNVSISKGEDSIDDGDWNKTKISQESQNFKIKYDDEIISLDFGEFNNLQTKFKDDNFEEIIEIGYFISPTDGLFTAIFMDSKSIDKQTQEKQKASLKKVPKILPNLIESLKYAFYGFSAQEIEGIENWNTENITDMSHMFERAEKFDHDISSWNTKNVQNMASMFWRAENFNQDIADWDTGHVTNMSSMFRGTKEFDQDISRWKVSNVTDMNSMFVGAKKFNRNITNWDVRKVDKYGLFKNDSVLEEKNIPEKFREKK